MKAVVETQAKVLNLQDLDIVDGGAADAAELDSWSTSSNKCGSVAEDEWSTWSNECR